MDHSGHRQRLRKRFKDAPEKPADYEILELLLGYVHLRRDTKQPAKALLQRFGSLNAVLHAPPEDITSLEGIGQSVADLFLLIKELQSRIAENPIRQRKILCRPETVAHMARQRLGKLMNEEIWIAFVDNNNRLISWEKASQGVPDASILYPRTVVTRALALNAAGLIMVHNHPGGSLAPSNSDIEITKALRSAAETLGIRLIDHLIITESSCLSITSGKIVEAAG